MKMSERTLRISAASVLALFMVGTAYALSGPNFLTSRIAGAGTTEELLKAYAEKDADTDGLPDWQEALYGTDPNKADTDGDGVTDGEAAAQGKLNPNSIAAQLPGEQVGTTTVADLLAEIPGVNPAPGSITEQFSRVFLEEVLAESNGQMLTDTQKQEVTMRLFNSYVGRVAKLFESKFTILSVRTDASRSVQTYVAELENVLKVNEVEEGGGDPMVLMEALIIKSDENARNKIDALADAYGAMRDDLLQITVPPTLADEHLKLLRSFDQLEKATLVVSLYEQDPMAMLGGLSVYQPSNMGVLESLQGISASLLSFSGEPSEGMPGMYILNAVRLVEQP